MCRRSVSSKPNEGAARKPTGAGGLQLPCGGIPPDGDITVGEIVVRELEQGKTSLRLDKVNQVLALFGHRMEPNAFRMEVDDEES